MLLIYLITGVIILAGGYVGHQPLFQLEMLTRRRILNGLLLLFLLFTLLMTAHLLGYFPQSVAAAVMMFLYGSLTGFFTGYAIRLLQLRSQTGHVLYVYRSFWTDHAPAFSALMVILYGLYRTSLLLAEPVTGIRLTSGLSLMAFGFLGLTIKTVPEFRTSGMLFLDQTIAWKQIMAWSWYSEQILRIEYLHRPGTPSEEVRLIQTAIPEDEKREIEAVLSSKMEEWAEQREKLLLKRERS